MQLSYKLITTATFCFIAASLINLFAAVTAGAETSLDFEWDPYYSNAGYYIGLTEQPIPEVTEEGEEAAYKRMLNNPFSIPRFMLLELSVNPLPLLGTYIKKHHENTYENSETRGDVNLIQAFTEGFEEPYAVSLFFGSVVHFVRAGEEKKAKNKGYTGYLFSFGTKHIVSNTLVDDDWYEIEWKTKGDQDFESKALSWSLRTGAKIHSNDEINDVIYFGLRRNHFDSASDEVSWFHNADIEYKIDLDSRDFGLVQQSLFINKKWPAPFTSKTAFEFGIGFILEKDKYTGSLQQESEDFRLILRPSFQF
jgi:hypothetical protein